MSKGRFKYCVLVPSWLYPTGAIHLDADRAIISQGSLLFVDVEGNILCSFAKPSWNFFYQIDPLSGVPVNLNEWPCEEMKPRGKGV